MENQIKFNQKLMNRSSLRKDKMNEIQLNIETILLTHYLSFVLDGLEKRKKYMKNRVANKNRTKLPSKKIVFWPMVIFV
jgi:hypothetical protein